MIDQLIKLVQQNAGDSISNNPAIPDKFKTDAVQEAGHQIFSGLKQQAEQGNIQGLLSLFKGGSSFSGLASNPIVTSIISNLAAKFASKFGVSQQVAQQVASGLIPKVMGQFINKTNDPNDRDFDMQDIIGNLTGNSSGIGDILGKFTGGKSDEGGLGNVLGKLF